eukprot:TRINITY_DN2221_c0_g1_i5.p1 TRINITY_DN2221_c0_g1~~TRINITY_DN2221_c0_g1_i5.p1  ORF type:complete len:419 (-),score=93.38 TRINITY_DN2221_c0_g1_i5:186-1442(-)
MLRSLVGSEMCIRDSLYNMLSFNTGFLCCCVPWCVLRITYWLILSHPCADDAEQMLQGFMLEVPINLEFLCFYFIMVYIMRQVRKVEGTWDREFMVWLKRFSVGVHTLFLACNVATVVISVTSGTRQSAQDANDSECTQSYEKHANTCEANGGCFSANETAANAQLGLSGSAFLLLALSLMFYGAKLHINAREVKKPANSRSMTDPTESIPQIAFGAGESPLVTEGVCIMLLLVFVSRSVFDAMQLDIFAPSPISIPSDKDITDFWIFFVYVAWEIVPISLMLFFFGTSKHAPKHTAHEKRFQAFNQPMTEDVEEPPEEPQAVPVAPNTYWPLNNPVGASASFTTDERFSERSHSPARQHLAKNNKSFMDNENRYDSQPGTPQQQPMREGTLQAGAMPVGRMGDRHYLHHMTQRTMME